MSKYIHSYSQICQDICVFKILDSNSGNFLDIGSNLPVILNNTFLFESHGWSGTCIDKLNYTDFYNQVRKCTYICGDALIEIPKLLEKYYNYISIDIDESSTDALVLLLKNNIKFDILTIEHDSYRHGKSYQNKQHQILYSQGYLPLFVDIYPHWCNDRIFEDWWYNPKTNLTVINKLNNTGIVGKKYISDTEIVQLLFENSI